LKHLSYSIHSQSLERQANLKKKNGRGCILPKQNSAINKIASLQRLVLNLILSNFQIDMLYTYQKTPIDEW
jgi:hypothetical protein